MRIHPFFKKVIGCLAAVLPKILLFSFFGLFMFSKINLEIVDLGRHLANGKLFVEQGSILKTNLYSYTNPNFPVITHHWGVGVIYYLVEKACGFTGLTILNAVLASAVAVFIYLMVRKNTSFVLVSVVLLCIAPLFATRKEVRPENFSYLLLAVYLFLFDRYGRGQLKSKIFFPVLFVLQVLWVNIHIFFVFGIMVAAIYVVYSLLTSGTVKNRIKLITPLFLVVTASLVNPFGVDGLLTPFNIFRNYGYMIAENQSIFFMQVRYPKFEYFFLEIAMLVTVGCWIYLLSVKKQKYQLPQIIISVIFSVLALKYQRAVPLFVIAAAPILISSFSHLSEKVGVKILFGAVFILCLIPGSFFSPFQRGFGIGLRDGSLGSLQFFLGNDLKGPIFNNYDIGSYLIYGLYPSEKVFVDNRPEAYPADFFTGTYVPMQEDEFKWAGALDLYDFNVIYFYRRDITPWAQPFLIKRLDDPDWAPVYVDDLALILVRNTPENEEIISKYRLPSEMFVVTKE